MKKIKIRKLKESTNAAAGVVVAMMLVGLIFSALAIVQGVYVPNWMEQKEADHMELVANQFSQLKFAIDTLAVSEQIYSPISSPITLGNREIPYLSSTRAYGSLKIDPNEAKINFIDAMGVKTKYSLGNIVYSSVNGYYINQDLIYENGAVILSQERGNVIKIQPALSVDSSGNLVFNIIRLVPVADKTTAGGYGTYPIQTKFLDSEEPNIYSLKSMTIETSYANAWKNYLERTLPGVFSINEDTDVDGNIVGLTIDFDDQPNLFLKMTEMSVQISPGWVE